MFNLFKVNLQPIELDEYFIAQISYGLCERG